MPERPYPIVDRVTLVEVNHHYNGEDGKLVFDQVIWYDWNARESRYDVVDWRLLKGVRGEIREADRLAHWKDPKNVPPPDPVWLGGHAAPFPDSRLHVSLWHDEKSRGVLRKVIARLYRETWTIYDPELIEREILPQESRRKLSEVHKRTQPVVR
jgi:hypothetical protein